MASKEEFVDMLSNQTIWEEPVPGGGRRTYVPTGAVLRIYNDCMLNEEDYNTFIRKLMIAGKYKSKAQAQERFRSAQNELWTHYGYEVRELQTPEK